MTLPTIITIKADDFPLMGQSQMQSFKQAVFDLMQKYDVYHFKATKSEPKASDNFQSKSLKITGAYSE